MLHVPAQLGLQNEIQYPKKRERERKKRKKKNMSINGIPQESNALLKYVHPGDCEFKVTSSYLMSSRPAWAA